jgi:prepilin-type N-terminal cleavage/methylation domain-containing protein
LNIYPKHIKCSNSGYTLLELIVVLAGLGILAGLAVPSFLKYLEHAKIDQAKSLLNSALAECLQIYRSEGISGLAKEPSILEREKLPDGYSYIDGQNKCQAIAVEDTSNPETLLITLGITIDDATGAPRASKWSVYKHPDTKYACEQWGGCGEGATVQAIIAEQKRRAEEQARLAAIEERYNAWLKGPPPGTGNYTADGKNIWAFQGRVLADEAKFNQVVEQECGKELTDALNNAKNTKLDGPFNYTGKSGGCSISTYLCSGKDVGSKDGYDACKEEERQTRCTAAEGRWIASGVNGKFSEPGCEVKWQCNKEILTSLVDYDKTSCATPPPVRCSLPPISYCSYRPTRPECKPICN